MKIFGIATGSWGIIMLFIIPDSIESSTFLNEEEKKHVLNKIAQAGTGKTTRATSAWKFEQVIECLIDPKTWFFFAISLCTQVLQFHRKPLRPKKIETSPDT